MDDGNGNIIEVTENVTLLETLDRVLNKGVVLEGELMISIANIDLVYADVRVLLTSVSTMEKLLYGKKDSE